MVLDVEETDFFANLADLLGDALRITAVIRGEMSTIGISLNAVCLLARRVSELALT